MPAPVLPSLKALVDVPSRRLTADMLVPVLNDYCALQGNGYGGHLRPILKDGDADLGTVLHMWRRAHEDQDANGEALAMLIYRLPAAERLKLLEHEYGEIVV